MKNKFILLVGLPGSGKSTYCLNHPTAEIISLDRMIEATMTPGETYAEAFLRVQTSGELKTMDKEMFRMAEIQAQMPAILNRAVLNKTVIWDQTNLTVKSRKRKIDMFNSLHWDRECVVFDLTNDEWEARLNKRKEETGKTIPKFVLEQMRDSFVLPTCDEGFDTVTFLGDRTYREA